MASEPPPWHPTNKAVVPYVMSNHPIDRTKSGGVVSDQLVKYGQTVLPPAKMKVVASELDEWKLRSKNPQRKFREVMIDHVDGLLSVYHDQGQMLAEEKLPLVEEFLMALRGPYTGGHVTMPMADGTRRSVPWVQDVLDFAYTLVAGADCQRVLRDQF